MIESGEAVQPRMYRDRFPCRARSGVSRCCRAGPDLVSVGVAVPGPTWCQSVLPCRARPGVSRCSRISDGREIRV